MGLNETIEQSKNYAGQSLDFIGKISEFIKGKVEALGIQYSNVMSYILTAFIGLLLLYLGMKIGNKIIKFLLLIFGTILILGTGYSIILKFIG